MSETRLGRLPRGRHGARQDNPGDRSDVAAETSQSEAETNLLIATASLIGNWRNQGLARFAASLKIFVAHRSETNSGGPRETDQQAGQTGSPNTILSSPRTRHGSTPRLACRKRPGRSSFSMKPRRSRTPRPPNARRQATPGQRAHRADRHARRKSAGRSVVAVRFPESRGCSARPANSRASSRSWKSAQPTASRRCADSSRPYMLRRLKTDRAIINDLPEKTEVHRVLRARPNGKPRFTKRAWSN